MPTAGGMRRDYIKAGYAKMAAGGSLVSDTEKQGFQNAQVQGAQQAIQAQQVAQNRAAMAAGSGAPVMAGAMKAGAQAGAQASADAAVKATGATQQYAQSLNERRAASMQAGADRLIQQNREDLDRAMEVTGRVTEAAGSIGSLIGGA